MIKCFGYLKLLKQSFFIGSISFFTLLVSSSVNAYTCTNDGNSCYDLEFGQVYSDFSGEKYIGNVVDRNFNFGSNVFLYNGYYQSTTFRRFGALWWESDGLHFTRQTYNANSKINGVLQGFFICSAMPTSNSLLKNNSSCEFYTNFVDLKNYISNVNRYLYYCNVNTTSNTCNICIYNDGGGDFVCVDYGSYYTSLTGGFLTEDEISSRAIRNPFSTSSPSFSGGGNQQVGDGGSLDDINYTELTGYVDYYENHPLYRFNKNVCYVGTNDFETLLTSTTLLSGLDFRLGSGASVFDFYSSLYGTSFSINDLGTFLNVRRSNYGMIFTGIPEEERLYRMQYNGGQSVSLIYSGITVDRFLYEPFVYYSMGQTLYSFGSQQSIGQDIALYCYHKLNYDTDSGNLSIIDDHSKSIDNNVNDFLDSWNRYHYNTSGSINIVSQSRNGTVLDYFTGTIEEDLDFSNFFNKSFNKFKNKFNNINIQALTGFGVLPLYIISFMLALIFFRFISH